MKALVTGGAGFIGSHLIDALIEKQSGERIIEIELYKESNNVIISIKDNGNGITESDLNKIFEPFYTTKNEDTGVTCGTGLGLSIVSDLVSSMNGKLTVNSIVDKGTEFKIIFFNLESTKDKSNEV